MVWLIKWMATRLNWLFLILIPLMILFISILMLYKPEVQIFPNIHNFHIVNYTDLISKSGNMNATNSEITAFKVENDSIELRSILHNDEVPPFAGVSFLFNGKKNINLNGFDILDLSIETSNNEFLKCFLIVDKEGFTRKGDYSSYVYFEYDMSIPDHKKIVSTRLSEFKIPQWWMMKNKVEKKGLLKTDFSSPFSFVIETGLNTPLDIENTIIIHKIIFRQDYLVLGLKLSGILALYFILYYFIFILLGQNYKIGVLSYQKLEIRNVMDEEQEKVISYIASNFQFPNLSLEKIGRELHFHPIKVGSIINKTFHIGFKQYLNKIRITEAKRLILETDLQINDIADAVGFSNTTHFNRVFKMIENISPSEYRKGNSRS